jgi:hypothetical protein
MVGIVSWQPLQDAPALALASSLKCRAFDSRRRRGPTSYVKTSEQ